MKFGKMKLEITGTGSIANDGSVEMSSTLTSAETIIDAGGVWNASQKITQSLGSFKLGSANTGPVSVDVYGTLNVKNRGTMTTVGSDLMIGAGTGTGIGRLNIKDDGLVDVDVYSISATLVASGTYMGQKRGMITIDGGGILKIKGNATAQVTADINTNGTIVGPHLVVWTGYTGGQQYTYVPEPATIALLGLGSLTLLRKKR
jgi:hypothetical protein